MSEMSRTRNLIRQDRLEKFGRILFGKKDLKLKLSTGSTSNLACCDTLNKVWVNSKVHSDPVINLILQKALMLHEMGHISYTKSSVWKRSSVPRKLSNIIEDGRSEEGVSRRYPKARLYFIFANRMFLSLKEEHKNLEDANFENLLLQLILRESMKRTGVPQFPKYVHVFLREKLGSDYHWLLNMTRKAVNVKKEEDCEVIASKIDMKLKEILEKRSTDNYNNSDNVTSSRESSLINSGGIACQMPEEVEDVLADILEQQGEDTEDNLTEPGSVDSDLTDPDKSGDTLDTSGTFSNEENEQSDDNFDDIVEIKLNEIMQQVEDTITQDVTSEIQTENDIIKSGDADADFSDYDVNEEKDFISYQDKYNVRIKPIDIQLLETHAKRIAHQFRTIAQFGDGWVHNQTRGKLETHKIPTIYTNNNPKMFKKRDKVQGVDLSVSILLDASHSMSGDAEEATKIAYVVTRALELGKYKSEVVQFGVSGDYLYGKHDIYGLKSFRQSLGYAKKRFVPCARGYTPLLPALEGSQKSLKKQISLRKVCFVVTDGYPYNGTRGEDAIKEYRELCRKKIKEMEKQGIIVIGIMIGTNDKHKIFREGFKFKCNKVSDVEKEMIGVLKRVLLSLKK